jgi:phosphate transport system substrate-binding protein
MKNLLSAGLALLAATVLRAAPASVDPGLPEYVPAALPPGSFAAAGDDDMEDVMRAWVGQFKHAHPGRDIALTVDSTATAAKAMAQGADLAFVGRKMLAPELAVVAGAWGYAPTAIIVAAGSFDDRDKTHAEAVWVNARNPISGLSLDQLDAIYGAERRRGAARAASTWGDLGLQGEWASHPVHAYRHRSVGVTQFVAEMVLRDGPWNPAVTLADKPKAVMAAVAADPDAIGFAGLGFAPVAGTRLIPVAGADGRRITPTRETVRAGEYPLSRVIYFYLRKKPGAAVDPAVREFLREVLSREGQLTAVQQGFLPLPAAAAAAELAKLD